MARVSDKMWALSILSALAFVIHATHASNSGYILTAPKRLLAGSVESICITLHNTTGPAKIKLELLGKGSPEKIAAIEHSIDRDNECLELFVPQTLHRHGILRLQATFEQMFDYSINSEHEIIIQGGNLVTLIQTDKRVYKPGQLVQFRILSLDHDFKPITDPIEKVWLENPSDVRLAQWLNVQTNKGLVHLEFQLSQEPVQGLWTIRVDRNTSVETKSFKVAEYVLPRFEVVISPPDYILADAELLTWKICAKYSYGQPVKGRINIKATPEMYSWLPKCGEEAENRKMRGFFGGCVEPPMDINVAKPLDGCFLFNVSGRDLGLFSVDKQQNTPNAILVNAIVTEANTDMEQSATSLASVLHMALKMQFTSGTDTQFFKPGLTYHGKLQVTTPNDLPVADEEVQVCLRSRNADYSQTMNANCRNFTSDSNGFVHFTIPTKTNDTTETYTVTASSLGYVSKYYSPEIRWNLWMIQPTAYQEIQNAKNPNGSYIDVLDDATEKPRCNYLHTFRIRVLRDKNLPPPVYHYLVKTRGDLIMSGHVKPVRIATKRSLDNAINSNSSTPGGDVQDSDAEQFGLKLLISPKMSPISKLLVYFVQENGETVATTHTIHTKQCFGNMVSAVWQHEVQPPGSSSVLHLAAAPHSLCSVSAVDKSTNFLDASAGVSNADLAFGFLEGFRVAKHDFIQSPEARSFRFCSESNNSFSDIFPDEDTELRKRRSPWYPSFFGSSTQDALQTFDDFGVVVLTNLPMNTKPCTPYNDHGYRGIPMAAMDISDRNEMSPRSRVASPKARGFAAGQAFNSPAPPAQSEAASVRSFFPETWLWDLVNVGKEGIAQVRSEVPHTITDWVGTAVCLSTQQGLGMSEPTHLTAFQPFFVELALPYSVKRGEVLLLKVVLFNFLPHGLPARVTLQAPPGVELLSDDSSVSECVAEKANWVHRFRVRASSLGQLNLTVSAEVDSAFPGECGPEFIVYRRDILRRPLLVKPEGFPIEVTKSAFICTSDASGEDKSITWDLTLPEDVIEGSARAQVSMAADLMGPALQNLDRLVQLPTGCGEQNMVLFVPNLQVVNYLTATHQSNPVLLAEAKKNMKKGYQRELNYRHNDGSYSAFGKSDKEGSMWLTAFVVKTFAQARAHVFVDEADLQVSFDWIVAKQLENGCFPSVGQVLHKDMKGGLNSGDSSSALSAYVLTSLLETGLPLPPGLADNAAFCLAADRTPDVYALTLATYATTLLNDSAAATAAVVRLMAHATIQEELIFWEKPGSASVSLSIEMTAYAILSLVKVGGEANLITAHKAVRWISSHRNARGGFVSTQDTVVALEALAKYAASLPVSNTQLNVVVTARDLDRSFRIQQHDRLVTQRQALPALPTQVEVAAVGEGCVLVQSRLRYNVRKALGADALELTLKVRPVASVDVCSVQNVEACVRYKPSNETSNMAVLEIAMASGYLPQKESLKNLDTNINVKRWEVEKDQVNLYFDSLPNSWLCLSLLLEQQLEVENPSPANVRLYDYYQPELKISKSYQVSTECEIEPLPNPMASVVQAPSPSNLVEDNLSARTAPFPNSPPIAREMRTRSEDADQVARASEARANPLTTEVPTTTSSESPAVADSIDFVDFVDVDHELEVPDGDEGPAPVFVLPSGEIPSATIENENGCPHCWAKFPSNFSSIYCNAASAYKVVVRRPGLARLLLDVTHTKEPTRLKRVVRLEYHAECNCAPLQDGNANTTMLLIFERPPVQLNTLSLDMTTHLWKISPALGQPRAVKTARSKLLAGQLSWQFAVGGNGKVVAVLQDTLLEIRTTKDEYSSVIGKASVAKDAFPQWRKMAWSADCSMLAVAHSNGIVSLYDLFGSNLCNLQQANEQADAVPTTEHALASVLFINSRVKSTKWSQELIAIDYHGNLRCYLVSPNEGFEESHTFTFGAHYRGSHGVSSVSYHAAHNLLLVAGPTHVPKAESLKTSGATRGLFAWRLLNDHPHYRFALAVDEKQAVLRVQRSLWNWVPSIGRKPKQSLIFKTQISPNGKLIACLHTCGSISLWHLPAIRLYRFWELEEQMDFDARNPQLSQKQRYQAEDEFHPTDVNWWSDQALIIARNSGAVSVCSVRNLHNLLGESPEFLGGRPRVSARCQDRGLLGLECETVHIAKKRVQDDSNLSTDILDVSSLSVSSGREDDDDDDDADLDASILERSLCTVQEAVYSMTDIERFQPQRKKPKLVQKAYRLLGLKSTTPEELYARKIDNEEYGEALALAKAYNLDCDLVYQRQWRNSNVSIATIHDYLSKITKRSWVLQECVERIPDTFGAARELLEFGLRGTNLETLVAIGEGTDGGHFVTRQPSFDDDDEDQEEDDEADEARREERNRELLAKLALPVLSEEQKQLLRHRQQLLRYVDRLASYELILGGPRLAPDLYDLSFYARYRSALALTSAVEFARDADWQAVRTVLTYHGTETLPHWLPVLGSFPESTNPLEYRTLLPECDGDGKVFCWEEQPLRPRDWCERPEFQTLFLDESPCSLYEEDSTLLQFNHQVSALTAETLTSWYLCRAQQIESRTGMADFALTLVKLARERNIKGLDDLHFHLVTVETLVYEVYLEHISLDAVQKLSPLDVCKLLMSRTTLETFVAELKYLLLPFLIRCDQRTPGAMKTLLRRYLLEVSSDNLSLPLTLFAHLRESKSSALAQSTEDTISLVLDCLYACKEADQLATAFRILECIPDRGFGPQSPIMSELHDRLDDLEKDLRAAAILERNGISKPLSFIRDCKKSVVSVRPLLVKMARMLSRKTPAASELEWTQLLKDMKDLQETVFGCIDLEQCLEIYIATLLASGSKGNIRKSGEILRCRRDDCSPLKVGYERSVVLLLDAANEYFDSAGSLLDPAMELSKACLHLVADKNELIEEKLDLIASLKLLNEFGISMLPLQVRLCGDRMALVASSVASKPRAYRNARRLQQLAQQLRVEGDDSRQREARVLVLVAETALEAKDYSYCAEKCQEITAKRHSLGWQVVQRLAQTEDFNDLRVRSELLDFALLYCTPENLEPLITTRCQLQAQLLQEKIESQLPFDHSEHLHDDDEFSDALTSPMSPEKEFVPILGLAAVVGDSAAILRQTTSGLLSHVRDKTFWKNTFSWSGRPDSDFSPPQESAFTRESYPKFYASAHRGCRLSELDTHYTKYSLPDGGTPAAQMCTSLLRVAQLEETVAAREIAMDSTGVFLELGKLTLPEDIGLGLSLLLSLPDPSVSDAVFSEMPWTATLLALATYFYALNVFLSGRSFNPRLACAYRIPSCQIVSHVTSTCGSVTEEPSLDKCKRLLTKYRELLADLAQADQLEHLNCGIDVDRFSRDSRYQRDTILGLAMTVDSARLSLSLSLADRHGVPQGAVATEHAAALLLAEGEDPQHLASRLADPKLIALLRSAPDHLVDRMQHFVYPSLSGENRESLLQYFTLLETVSPGRTVHILPAKEHVKLLKKLKAAHLDIDYKKLTEEPLDVLAAFQPILSRGNVSLVAKLLKSLPLQLKHEIELESLHSELAKKEFFAAQRKKMATADQCLTHFEACAVHLAKLGPESMQGFLQDICFTEKSVEVMSESSRIRILDAAIELTTAKESDEWYATARTFSRWRDHLATVASFDGGELAKHELGRLLRFLDLSRGEPEPIRRLLHSAVVGQTSLPSLRVLLQLLPKPTPTLEQLLEDFLTSAITDFRGGDDTLLPAVLRRMQENVDAGGTISPHLDGGTVVRDSLEPLCRDIATEPSVKLQALQLLHSLQLTSGTDDDSLVFHQTQATVESHWSDVTVGVADTASEESRSRLFGRLEEKTSSWQQVEMLYSILEKWPAPSSPIDSTTDPWAQYLQKLLYIEGSLPEKLESLLKRIFLRVKFTEQCLRQAVAGTENVSDQTAPVLAFLMSDFPQLHLAAASIVCRNQQPASDATLSLLVSRGVGWRVVSAPCYRRVVDRVLDSNVQDSASQLASNLCADGSLAEAGTLRLLAAAAPAALRVFSVALATARDEPQDRRFEG